MDLDQRLRAARPPVPDAEPDDALLARVMTHPVDRRRGRPLALPAVAVAAIAVAAIALLGGGRPDTAVAISQAMRWFDPPAGSVVHSTMVDDSGQTREFWQDVDHAERSRIVLPGGDEIGAGALYEHATNTIYLDHGVPGDAAKRAKLAQDDPAGAETQPPPGERVPANATAAGDPIVAKVRALIDDGRAAVQGRATHDGVDAWKIALTDTADRDPWVLWVRADDGKPLAIDDPGNPVRNKAPEHLRWTRYDVLDRDTAPLTLREAHPDARVVDDPARFDAVLARLSVR